MKTDKANSYDHNDNLFFQNYIQSIRDQTIYLLNAVKDNIAVIVLIPTILGGLIQLFKLGIMDLRYIRYFSVTQLVPDGLLAILLLSVSALIVYTNIKFLLSTIPTVSRSSNKTLGNTHFMFHVSIAIGMTITVVNSAIKINFFMGNYSKQDVYMCIAILGFTYFNIAFILLNIRLVENKNFLTTADTLKQYIAKLFFIALGSLMIIALIFTSMRMSYLAIEYINEPKGAYNYSMIKNSIDNDFEKYKSYEILYFNDKYTFVKVYIEDSDFTVIYKTDNVFFNPTSIEIQ